MKQTSKQFFTALQIVQIALIIGVLMFTLVSTFVFGNEALDASGDLTQMMQIVVPSIMLLCLIMSRVVINARLRKMDISLDLAEKLNLFRANMIIRWALLEAPALLAVIALILTGDQLYYLHIVAMLALLAYMRPSRQRAIAELELSTEQEQLVLNDDAEVAQLP